MVSAIGDATHLLTLALVALIEDATQQFTTNITDGWCLERVHNEVVVACTGAVWRRVVTATASRPYRTFTVGTDGKISQTVMTH